MYLRMARRLLTETDKRLLWKLFWNMGVKGLRSVQKHKGRLKRGEFFPPFLYISIINSCNLRCQGCWVDVAAKQERIEADALHKLIGEAKEMGNSFFGIVGGEPFMHPRLAGGVSPAIPTPTSRVFTNGQFITDDVARQLRRLGNVTPLDQRSKATKSSATSAAAGSDVLPARRWRAFDELPPPTRSSPAFAPASARPTSTTCSTTAWVDRLIEMGVMYTWFHVYRPVGPDACPDLALTPEQQKKAREFVVRTRATKPIIVVDAYYDADGKALCPAATGFTHHISPWGGIEPCPVIQLATESIYDDRPLKESFNNSRFLTDFRKTAAEHTRGCIILERPDLLVELADKYGAKDTTARGTHLAELSAMQSRPSQYNPGDEVPERSLAYRLAKRLCFNDFGAYGRHFELKNWKDPREAPAEREMETVA